MNLQEFCNKYDIAESSVVTTFPKVQKKIYQKYGIYITKIRKDDEVIYLEQKDEEYRGTTLQDELENLRLIKMTDLKDTNWEFIALLSLVMTKNLSFRGKYKDYLRDVNIKCTDIHIKKLRSGFQELKRRNFIFYEEEDNEYFIVGLKRETEVNMKIGLEMIFTCKALSKINNRRNNAATLIKVWIGTQLLYNVQYTLASFSRATGMHYNTLTLHQVGILETSSVFRSSIGYNNFKKYLYPYTFDKN